MLLEAFLSAAILVAFLLAILPHLQRSPPGPLGLPFLGYHPFLGSDPFVKLMDLANEYGDILKINLFGKNFYILNSIDLLKKVFVAEKENVAGRPLNEYNVYRLVFTPNNIISLEGEKWKSLSKFLIVKLSSLGMGKSHFELKIQEMCEFMISKIRETNAEPNNFYEILRNYTSNVLSKLLFNKYYDLNDPLYIKLSENTYRFFLATPNLDAYYYGFIFELISKINGKYKKLNKLRQDYSEFIHSLLDDRIKRGEADESDDLLNLFLKEMKGPNAANFDLDMLFSNFCLLFADPAETGATWFYHALNLMALFPNIQQKVFNEIENIFGIERQVEFSDRRVLHYTQAVIAEIERYSCIVPLTLVRTNYSELTVGKYRIPKRSKLIGNIWKLSRDRKYFENADHFDPNHFLDDNGCFLRNEASIPFSVGKRRCAGIKVAEVQNFIGFVTLIQRFKWLPPENETVKRDIQEGILRLMKPYQLRAIPR